MTFILTRASNSDYKKKIEVNTIEELAAINAVFVDEINRYNNNLDTDDPKSRCLGTNGLIIEFDEKHGNTITIYDDYVE